MEDEDYQSDSYQEEIEDPASPADNVVTNNFKILTMEDVEKEMNEICGETSTILGLPIQCCKVLLNIFRWDKDKLLEKFYESESPEKFFIAYKIKLSTEKNTELISKIGDCYICFDKKRIIGLSCGHLYCNECWESYLSTRFREENDAFPFCIGPDCKMIADNVAVLKLLSSENEKAFYKKFIVKTAVNSNPHLKWCPGQDCEMIAKCSSSGCQPIQCKCGTLFCFFCSQEAHEPVPCDIIKRWAKKIEGDSLTMKWISVSTKDCPKCGIPIEKNGGCNRMVCKNNSCNFQFCWSCLKDWNVHGYEGANSCNRYEPKEEEKAESRRVLQRYMHYYDRFINHKNSLKAETTLVENINTKITQMQSKNCYSWIETQFLIKALDSLKSCRRMLMYSYAFAFYLPSSNQKHIFEDNQADLEHATEELSGLLEQEMDLEKDDFNVLKQKVQDRYRYVDHRREVMFKHCTEGLEKDEWKFITVD
uniref:RBR-type E3 ubiquitin transferase n=1 Tax=Panagrolaimus sp. PS1159 TaxID=55785 RepID=A0AC35GPW0_9BILA